MTKVPSIKAVIFDFGGVLAEVSMFRVCQKLAFLNVPRQKLFNALMEAYYPYSEGKGTLEDVRARASFKVGVDIDRAIFKESFTNPGKYNEDVVSISDSLRPRYKTFVLSSNHKELAEKISPRLLSHFDRLYFSHVVGVTKPDPRAYQMVLDENRLKAEECVFIDDYQPYLDSAAKLGMKTILFKGAKQLRADLERLGVGVDGK